MSSTLLSPIQSIDNHSFNQSRNKLVQDYFKVPEGIEAVQKYSSLDKTLKESDIIKYALKTGDRIPNFTLPNTENVLKNIFDLHEAEWLVLSFYRGSFCPFCNLELRYLQKHLSEIEGLPARLVAISPQTVENSLATAQKNALDYEVLSDKGAVVAKKFNLVYQVPDYLVEFHKKIGIDNQYFNSEGIMELPLPSTYIIDREGIIRFHFLETNPANRMPPEDIVQFIRNYSN
jgi:peroxiredoxin